MWCIQNKEHVDKLFIVAVMCLPTTPYTTRTPIFFRTKYQVYHDEQHTRNLRSTLLPILMRLSEKSEVDSYEAEWQILNSIHTLSA